MNIKLFFILLLLFPEFSYAQGQSLSSICTIEKATFVRNKTVQNFNVTRDGYINYKLDNDNVWYLLNKSDRISINNGLKGSNFQYKFLNLSYITGARINVCIDSDGNTIGLERTYISN